MRLAPLLIVVLLASSLAEAGIYRHKDKYGNTVYTDAPPEDTEVESVQLQPLNTVPGAPKQAPGPTGVPPPPGAVPPVTYTSLSLMGVQNGTMLRNPQEDIVLGATIDKPLGPGHRLVFIHNGQATDCTGGTCRISEIERGEHVFSVEIRDQSERVLIASEPATITVFRPTVQKGKVTPR